MQEPPHGLKYNSLCMDHMDQTDKDALHCSLFITLQRQQDCAAFCESETLGLDYSCSVPF